MQSIQGRNPADGETVQVIVRDGRIREIVPSSSREERWLSPGFIDLQINGYCGYDFNSESLTPEVVVALARQLVSLGVTTFLPTLITAAEGRIVGSHHKPKALAKVASAWRLAVRLYWMLRINTPYPEIARIEGSPGVGMVSAS